MRFLKFDMLHPADYWAKKQHELANIQSLSLKEYNQLIIKQRINFSDYYTYYLQQNAWECEEFFVNDPTYIDKVATELFGGSTSVKFKKLKEHFKDKLRPTNDRWLKFIISSYIEKFKPDIIFVREPLHLESSFWSQFGQNTLLINRIATVVTQGWNPTYWDLIYTSTPEYKIFFELNKVQSIINPNGFDTRLVAELGKQDKNYDVIFIGGLYASAFGTRMQLMQHISQHFDFKWWGYGIEQMEDSNILKKNWQGYTSGLEMFGKLKASKIVLNDYIDMANGNAVNQRLFEVMGVGTFMLTDRKSVV